MGGGEWRARCPIHGGNNQTSFWVKDHGKWWGCFACKEHGHITALVQRLLRLTPDEARLFVEDAPRKRFDASELGLPRVRSFGARKEPDQKITEASIAPYKGFCPVSLLERGFSRDVLRVYDIGYDSTSCRCVFPLRGVDGTLHGLTYRLDYIQGNAPKYWHGFEDKTSHIYGLHLWAGKEVDAFHITEGNLDPVRLYQLGQAAGAIMGSYISGVQRGLLGLVRFKRLVVALDFDDAGVAGAVSAIHALVREGHGKHLQVMTYPGGIKDPGDLCSMTGTCYIPWLSAVPWLRWIRAERAHEIAVDKSTPFNRERFQWKNWQRAARALERPITCI